MRAEALRHWLEGVAGTVTYAEAMKVMGIANMKDLTQALELLMEQDHAAGSPLLAARVVSRTRPLPNRGFFDKARDLGLDVVDEAVFHRDELAALGGSVPAG